MGTVMAPMGTATTLQAANTLSGNGTAADITGAQRSLILISAISGSAGVYTFEISKDGGNNWVAANAVRLATGADDGSIVAATTAGSPSYAYKVDHIPGQVQFRARISTNWTTNAPKVELVTVGK